MLPAGISLLDLAVSVCWGAGLGGINMYNMITISWTLSPINYCAHDMLMEIEP